VTAVPPREAFERRSGAAVSEWRPLIEDVRTAYLYKSPRLPQGRARYTITEGGVRDVRGTKRPFAGDDDAQGWHVDAS